MTRRVRVASLVVAAALLGGGACAIRHAGSWLVVDDPLMTSRAIVVLGGQLPFRAVEAARIYSAGAADQVWLTQSGITDEAEALQRMGIEVPGEEVYNRMVLERLGVPATAVHVLPDRAINTADELRAALKALRGAGGSRVIFVTSKYHTRRVKVLWRVLAGRSAAPIVRYTPEDPFQPDRWWRSTHDSLSVAREWLGLMNAWLGFPVPARRSAG